MKDTIKLLRKENYPRWIQKLLDAQPVYAPVRTGQRVNYQRIHSSEEIDGNYILPDSSVKSFVFPAIEKLFDFTKNKEEVSVQDIDLEAIPHKIVLGVRPCDAAGISKLAAIFNWEPQDPIFNQRAERTTIVSFACNRSDEYCFCTSIGGSPGNTEGSDLQLTKTGSDDYLVEILTGKGEKLIALAPELFEEAGEPEKEKYLASVPQYFDDKDLETKMQAAFDTLIFDTQAMRCVGCSACAFVCPVCACFDIQDESKGKSGKRLRCWDSCGSALFTLHTSGHNPRETQGSRWRQRLMHKFSYMPERLNVRGCVGCGRCSRRCPVDMNLSEHLSLILHS